MPTPDLIKFIARGVLAALFILAGLTKILGPKPVLDHMREEHVPGLLLPLVAAFEIGAGGAVMAGWHVAWAAGALAAFCVATAVVFHRRFSVRAERTSFRKDLALAGALAFVAVSAG